MSIYIVNTILSCFFVYLNTKTNNNKPKINIWGWIGIIVPSLIAAIRDNGIGSDTNSYGRMVFAIAYESNSVSTFLNSTSAYIKNTEPLYKFFVYFISRMTNKICFQYFFIELFIMFFVLKSLLDMGTERKAWVGMFIYHMLFYSFSLNLMRQMMAMALLLWGFRFVKRKKLVNYLLTVIVASCIHIMAIEGIAIYFLYIIFSSQLRSEKKLERILAKYKFIFDILTLTIAGLVLVFSPKIISTFSILKESFIYQLQHLSNELDFNYAAFLLMNAMVFPLVIFYKNVKRYNEDMHFYIITLILATLFWQLSAFSGELYRVAIYFWGYIILAVPIFIKEFSNYKAHRQLMQGYYIILASIYYVYMFVILLINYTYPYTSAMLTI